MNNLKNYRQVKKNIKLTCEDIEKIHNLIKQLQVKYTDTRGCYQEVSKLFNKEVLKLKLYKK